MDGKEGRAHEGVSPPVVEFAGTVQGPQLNSCTLDRLETTGGDVHGESDLTDHF
jgi:hypothetical protein